MFDDTLVQGAHVHGLLRVGCLPGRPPLGPMPRPVTAREIATIADCKTYWYWCTFVLDDGPKGEQVRRILERERDWYARNHVPLPAGREVIYALNGVQLDREASR